MKKTIMGIAFASVMSLSLATYAVTPVTNSSSGTGMEKTDHKMDTMPASKMTMKPGAMAEIIDVNGKKVGTATFTQLSNGVRVNVNVSGMKPGVHAIHIHQVGKCEAATKFKTAGGHFNPAKHEHGFENPKGHHNGDMTNLTIDAKGNGTYTYDNAMLSLGTGEDSILKSGGTSIVIHAKADDEKSQPAGNAGDRVGCGVIVVAK